MAKVNLLIQLPPICVTNSGHQEFFYVPIAYENAAIANTTGIRDHVIGTILPNERETQAKAW